MNKEERDKFLTGAMGECWHEPEKEPTTSFIVIYRCKKCGISWDDDDDPIYMFDFSTWEGFGKLWEWAIDQKWWADFQCENYQNAYCHFSDHILTTDIHPDRFADAIYGYLKSNGR